VELLSSSRPGDFDVEDVMLSADKAQRPLHLESERRRSPAHLARQRDRRRTKGPKRVAKTIEWNPVETSDGKNGVVSRLNSDFARHGLIA